MPKEKKVNTGFKWKKPAALTVGTAMTVFLLQLWWGHFAVTASDHRTQEEVVEIQGKLSKIVENLSSIHSTEEAALAKVAELCRAGKLKDCDDCAEADVELPACMAN